MGKFSLSSSRAITGPWFIGIKQLEEIDQLLIEIDRNLEESFNEQLNYEAEESIKKGRQDNFQKALEFAKKNTFGNYKNEVTLISKNGSRLTDSSLEKLLIDPKIKDFKPKELNVEIKYNFDNKFSLDIVKRFDGELKYKIECFNDESKHKINYLIENWIEENKPSKAKQLWHQLFFLFIIIFGITSVLSLITIYSSKIPSSSEIYGDQIHSIINEGINSNNRDEAFELLLKINTNYIPEGTVEIVQINPYSIKLSIIALIFLLIFIFRPRTTIGVGKYKSRLKIYQWYTKVVLVSLPLLILVPWIIDIIKSYL